MGSYSQVAPVPHDTRLTGSQWAVQTLAPGIVFCLLLRAETQLPIPQSLELVQKGAQVLVRQSHHAPAGHGVSLLQLSKGASGLAARVTQWVVPVSSLWMVQRFPAPQSSLSWSSRHIAGKPLLLDALVLELTTLLALPEPLPIAVLDVLPVPLAPPAPPVPVNMNVG